LLGDIAFHVAAIVDVGAGKPKKGQEGASKLNKTGSTKAGVKNQQIILFFFTADDDNSRYTRPHF